MAFERLPYANQCTAKDNLNTLEMLVYASAAQQDSPKAGFPDQRLRQEVGTAATTMTIFLFGHLL